LKQHISAPGRVKLGVKQINSLESAWPTSTNFDRYLWRVRLTTHGRILSIALDPVKTEISKYRLIVIGAPKKKFHGVVAHIV
jgi:hypothetical protein